jgi:hypothetical protein
MPQAAPDHPLNYLTLFGLIIALKTMKRAPKNLPPV